MYLPLHLTLNLTGSGETGKSGEGQSGGPTELRGFYVEGGCSDEGVVRSEQSQDDCVGL